MEEEISKMTYEQALIELEKIVSELESGSATLDNSIELYTRGSLLKEHCQKKLNAAEEKISTVVENSGDSFIQIEDLPVDQKK
tara:strand:+ start:207 stop:455 length:249 start_codon:yes stop_codon:yes gene_type:complete